MSQRRESLTGYLFLIPFLVLFSIFVLLPVGISMWLSVVRLDLANAASSEFVGAQNYRDALADNYFWMAAQATGKYALLSTSSIVIIGCALAMGLHRMAHGQEMARPYLLAQHAQRGRHGQSLAVVFQ